MAEERIPLHVISDLKGRTNLSEDQIAKQVLSTDMHWSIILQRSGLDRADLAGKSTLDIGGGASSLTPKLVREGEDAYAIDPRYTSRSTLKGLLKKTIQEMPILGEEKGMRLDLLNAVIETMAEYPDRFLAAYATSLPFLHNRFDVVFSNMTLIPQGKLLIPSTEPIFRSACTE